MICRFRCNCTGYRSALILAILLRFTPTILGQEQGLLPALDVQFEPLRAQFDHDVGKVRLLILLDPT